MEKHKDSLLYHYPVRIRIAGITVLLLVAGLFFTFPRADGHAAFSGGVEEPPLILPDIPPNVDWREPVSLRRPSIPIESDKEDIPIDETIPATGLPDFHWYQLPPPPKEEPDIVFKAYDQAPEPIGGYAALSRNVRYPAIAREARIEGRVIVRALIDKKGRVVETVIKEGIPNTGLDEAAAEAIRRTRFRPAKQRDKPVAVWIEIPIRFGLQN
jgi:protein TonB